MSITVNYALTPWLITVPKSDLTLESGTKYKLDVDVFWGLLRDYADSPESMPNPIIYTRIPATTSTPSITNVNLDYYQIQFEDGAYSVNIINGNTNIREAEVKNAVSVNTNNTTGFIDAEFLEHSTFGGGVSVNPLSPFAVSGTKYPAGTPAAPCFTFAAADTIADARGFNKFFVGSDMTLTSLDFSDGHIFEGENAVAVTLTIETGANVTGCEFKNLTITGVLDGSNIIRECSVLTLSYVQGFMFECAISDKITLIGGNQATITDCFSGVAGGGGGQTAEIDCGGSGSLALRGFSGGINLSNYTGSGAISMDMASGRVIVESTVTAPEDIYIRGIADVTDNNGGSGGVNDLTVNKKLAEVHGQVQRSIFIDTEQVTNGNGYQQTPYNNWTDGVDAAEANNLLRLMPIADATVDRQLKNFTIEGIGLPTIDLNDQIMDKSIFRLCQLTGGYSGDINAIECAVNNLSGMNGVFYTVNASGTLTVGSSGSVTLWNVTPAIPGASWILNMNTGAGSTAAIHKTSGEFTVTNMDDAADLLHIHSDNGTVTIDSSCANGTIEVNGDIRLIDNSGVGCTINISSKTSEILLDAIA